MFLHEFERGELAGGGYAINHPERETRLAQEIEAAIPGKLSRLDCHGPECSATFTEDLTEPELAEFLHVVSDHKNNVQV